MRFQGALVREQGQTFAIAVVKPQVLNSSHDSDEVRISMSRIFGGVPIILMAQNSRGIPTYSGRRDIVNFLARIPMEAIPWREYTYN